MTQFRVGIPASFTGDNTKFFNNQAYFEYVKEAGYEGVMITPQNKDTILPTIDGILLPGGADIDPMMFGISNYASKNCNPEMDFFWIGCLEYAQQREIPVFGICRGFQLLAYMALCDSNWNGFGYYQHIESPQSIHRDFPGHMIWPTKYAFEFGQDINKIGGFAVNSLHHQALVL